MIGRYLKPIGHGFDHRPGGSDPSRTGVWLEAAAASAWDSGSTYAANHVVSHGEFKWRSIATSTAIEPGVTTGWQSYWIYDASTFLNGYDNVDDPDVDTFAYRLCVGPPSNYVQGDTIDESGTSPEFKGAAVGGPIGAAIIRLIPGYRPPKKRHRAANDEFGGHICLTVDADGYVYRGFV